MDGEGLVLSMFCDYVVTLQDLCSFFIDLIALAFQPADDQVVSEAVFRLNCFFLLLRGDFLFRFIFRSGFLFHFLCRIDFFCCLVLCFRSLLRVLGIRCFCRSILFCLLIVCLVLRRRLCFRLFVILYHFRYFRHFIRINQSHHTRGEHGSAEEHGCCCDACDGLIHLLLHL